MKKILLIGSSGFIGSALCSYFAGRGYKVFALSRRPHAENRADGVESIVASQDNVEVLLSVLPQCDCVIHAASDSTPGDTAHQPALELDLNVRPSLRFMEVLSKFPDIHLLYFSSAGALYQTGHSASSTELDVPIPRSNYGAGKLAVEAFIGAAVRSQGGAATILRPSNVYGPGQTFRPGFGIVPALMKHVSEGRAFQVWGDGRVERDYLYIDDLVRLCDRALQNPAGAGEVRCFNAGSGSATTTLDLMRILGECAGREIRPDFRAVRNVDSLRTVVDSGKAASQLGWRPVVSLEEGIRLAWAWHLSRLAGHQSSAA